MSARRHTGLRTLRATSEDSEDALLQHLQWSAVVRPHNDETTWDQMLKERDDLERDVVLLKEQLRVADVAYNYWTKRCQELEEANERANKLIEGEANKRSVLTSAIKRTLTYLRSPQAEDAEYIERLLENAL
jgi:hypothetical protein